LAERQAMRELDMGFLFRDEWMTRLRCASDGALCSSTSA